MMYFTSMKILEKFVQFFLLPLYFAMSGLQTDFTTLRAYPDVVILIAVCLIATLGKFIGAGVSAYFCKISKRESAVIAVLMNTRGLVELIVLNIGLKEGVLNKRIFSVMVIMCLFTTFMTCPLILWIYPSSLRVNYITSIGGSTEVHDYYDCYNYDHNHEHFEISHNIHYTEKQNVSIATMESKNKETVTVINLEEEKYDADAVNGSV